jgi:predicted nuclease of restriction endonuclease-like (RecB) superfamily
MNESEYKQWVSELKSRIRSAQVKAAVRVNCELINLYWSIGHDIVERKIEESFDGDFYSQLSADLHNLFPDVKGFSRRNLIYMRSMYLLFSPIQGEVPQLVALNKPINTEVPQTVAHGTIKEIICQIPWGHIRYIIDKHTSPQEAFFYVQKTLENGWSRAMLLNMMDTRLYEAQGKAINNFANTLPSIESDYARQITKDPYSFDFLTLKEDYRERELQKALEENIVRFLMELGKGFAFVGRQVRLEVNGDEYFCDLLFYHIPLKRYVIVELKTVRFEPEFVSKVNFYCNAVNHLMKTEGDNETIGLLICKEKNDVVAQWTVENAPVPIAISRYELRNMVPVQNNIEIE